MKFILGTKKNMMEYFREDGQVVPVTVLSVSPVKVTRIFSKDKDGYDSVQVGFKLGKKEKSKEFRLKAEDKNGAKEGDVIDVSVFASGDKVQVSSISKGKGFQGVVKRHRFEGGPRSHGQKHSEREPGSIGGGLRTHVPKGMRMAGRTGSDTITVKNLQILEVTPESNQILISGAIPGSRGTLLKIVGQK